MLIRLLKLPFKPMALILIPGLMILHFIGSLVLGLSSIVTHILASVFLFGSAADSSHISLWTFSQERSASDCF